MHGDEIAGAEVLELSIEREKVAALANRTDDVDTRAPFDGINCLNSVVRFVVRRPQQIGHAGIDDEQFLPAAALPIQYAADQHRRVPYHESARLDDELQRR